jgi:hypothetical protein
MSHAFAHPFRSLALVAALALPLGASLGCSHAGQVTGWQVNRTRNVVLYTDARLEHEFIQEWLELSHAALQAFFPEVNTGPVEAVWLKNEPGSLTRLYSPLDDPRAGWTFETMPSGRIGRDGLIVLERKLEHRGMSFAAVRDETLAKEQMAHLFIMKAVRGAPLWLQVGLGRYLQKFRIHHDKDFWLACFGGTAFDEPVRAGLGSGREVMLNLDELFSANWYRYDKGRRHWYEHTAYALVHFLLHGKPGHKQRFPIFLKALREGQSSEDALATGYPHILPDEWENLLADYVRPPDVRARIAQEQYLPQGICLRIPPAHHADDKPAKTPADAREIQILMSDLIQVEPFRRHSGWWPEEIVRAEAAKRPGRGRLPAPPPAKPTQPGPASPPSPPPPDDVPTVRTPAAPPPD